MSRGREVHDLFAQRAGSDYIATTYALEGLDRALRRRAPRTVLEVGPGIGTTTSLVIRTLDELHGPGSYELCGIEHVEFCLQQMELNLGSEVSKTTVVSRYEELPEDVGPFEFVLVDGGGEGEADGSLPAEHVRQQNRLYVSRLAERAVVFVENKRPDQRAIFEAELDRPWSYVHVRPWNDAPGYHLYQLEPGLRDRLHAALRRVADRWWYDTGCARWTNRQVRRVARRLGRRGASGGPGDVDRSTL